MNKEIGMIKPSSIIIKVFKVTLGVIFFPLYLIGKYLIRKPNADTYRNLGIAMLVIAVLFIVAAFQSLPFINPQEGSFLVSLFFVVASGGTILIGLKDLQKAKAIKEYLLLIDFEGLSSIDDLADELEGSFSTKYETEEKEKNENKIRVNVCPSCGSTEFLKEGKHRRCEYCQTIY